MEEMRTFQHEIEFDREYRLIAADGSVKWVWERDAIVRDEDGRPRHTEGVMVDITERKLAEDRAQHYLDVAGTILLVLRTDQTVELLNRHGRELLGYEDGELIGKDWYDAVVPEEDRPSPPQQLPARAQRRGRARSPTTRATSSPAAASAARSPGATRCCATRPARSSASSPRARTSPSACARRRRSPASPTSTR